MTLQSAGNRNYLGLATTVAVVLHCALIFGVGFHTAPPDVVRDMEIILVQNAIADPENSQSLAESNQSGSDRQSNRSPPAARVELNRSIAPVNSEGIGDIANLIARLDRQRQHHASLRDTLVLTTASAKTSNQASYLKRWIERVELIGNANYPEIARRHRIYGAIRLAVTLERDGRVAGIDILRSSGHKVLDQAALHTLRLAAPFEPVPDSISGDRIEIIRTWHFIPGHQVVIAQE